MIGRLTGRVEEIGEDHALIDVGGVGYVVQCSARTLRALETGAAAALHTEMVVREDAIALYGFASRAERDWHRLLTSVQGVGARLSLAILGALDPGEMTRALARGDAAAIRAAPGVGPKLAARIVNELRDKAPALMAQGAQTAPRPAAAPPAGDATADALSALVNLGYGEAEAARAVAEAAEAGAEGAGALIRAALKALGARAAGGA